MLIFVASVLIGTGALYYPTITSTQANESGYVECFVQRKGLVKITNAVQKANNLARHCNQDGGDACALNSPDYQEYLLKVIVPH